MPPRGKGHVPKAVHDLVVGDKMHRAEEAVVLSRFMVPVEEEEDSE